MNRLFISGLVLLLAFQLDIVARDSGETFIVTSTADSGAHTFRQAMQDAQSGDSITFDPSMFPPASPDTITLASQLPQLTQGNLVIDASDAGVVIDGGSITTTQEAHGISINSDNNVIRGLQIINFSFAGITLSGGARNNTIGGDRNIGRGPLGQGNLVSGDGLFGIGMWGEETSFNTIQGNVIGTDVSGTIVAGNFSGGIFLEGPNYNLIVDNLIGGYVDNGVSISRVSNGYNTVRGNYVGTDTSGLTDIGPGNSWSNGIRIEDSGFNVVGPSNVITNNGWAGVLISGDESVGNRITGNSIHDNSKFGIDLESGGNNKITTPFILDFDLQADTLAGWAYPSSIVEVFSDSSDEGACYEGQAAADSNGFFTFRKETAFTGPYLTATATDPDGNTSEFSLPTHGEGGSYSNQEGNAQVMTFLQPNTSSQLPTDIRLGTIFYSLKKSDFTSLPSLWKEIINMGAKRVDTQLNEFEPPIDWSFSEIEIPIEFDQFIDTMNENGVAVNYLLLFWDKAGHAAGDTLPNPRFSTEQDIQRFLDYVRYIVGHFKDRVEYYTIWGEQGYFGSNGVKGIEPNDYIELSRQSIPVIKEIDPQAKVVTGPLVLQYETYHLYPLLRSDVIQLFDVISTHPFFDAAPDNTDIFGNYYYDYPLLIEDILQTASTHGFLGEYWGYSLTWMVNELHTPIQTIKYNARVMVMHLGLDYGTGTGPFLNPEREPVLYYTWANLFTIMAGTKPADLGLEIESDATNIVSYGFTHPNGDRSLALWTDGAAVDYDQGVKATLTIPGMSASRVTSIDVLKFFQQELITEVDSSNLIIRNLNVKDYPLIIMLSKSTETGIPDDNRSQLTFALHQNFPNPFNLETTIKFRLPKASNVILKIFNINGQEIKTIIKTEYQPGNYSVKWDGTNNAGIKVASGIYFYRLKAGDFKCVKKMFLLK